MNQLFLNNYGVCPRETAAPPYSSLRLPKRYRVSVSTVVGVKVKRLNRCLVSNILTALAVGIQIGINPLVGNLGGIAVTVPTMLFWYVPTGLAEALFTSPIVLSLSRVSPTKLNGLSMLQKGRSEKKYRVKTEKTL